MRYIRTKTRIIDLLKYSVVREKEDRINFFYEPEGDSSYWFRIDKKDVINQADTIEELCDFVDIQYQDNSWETYNYKGSFKIKLLFKKSKQVFYGIRTDKGLIYVAKMNEEGELELL